MGTNNGNCPLTPTTHEQRLRSSTQNGDDQPRTTTTACLPEPLTNNDHPSHNVHDRSRTTCHQHGTSTPFISHEQRLPITQNVHDRPRTTCHRHGTSTPFIPHCPSHKTCTTAHERPATDMEHPPLSSTLGCMLCTPVTIPPDLPILARLHGSVN
ncbi:hypothetical protein K443DRAFT_117798 [Laccaria amethystina LaAM-08-1]|uniref:Uncharacterized protein n=1 Tax=Laccaria amethystina LaAM-08-1 TaxID=1095629 RepID=A0A0C9WPQ2_9AGAR|nr:hypothetical protein K443DRAFT_117798 [Laccaria amethystina LaAM-08-1]